MLNKNPPRVKVEIIVTGSNWSVFMK